MRTNVIFVVGVIGTFAIKNAAMGQEIQMPRGAFLLRPVTNTQALHKEICTEPTVLQRNVATFKLSPDTVKESFAHLRLVPLKEDGIFQVHYVHPGERIGYRIRRVRKGTLIFADPNGTPILARVCGNPLRSGPDVALLNAGTQTGRLTIPDFQPDEAPLPLSSDFTPTSDTLLRSVIPAGVPGPEVIPEAVATTVESPLPPIATTVASAGGVGGWAGSGILAAVAAGGIIAGLSGGSDTSGGGSGGGGTVIGGGGGGNSGGTGGNSGGTGGSGGGGGTGGGGNGGPDTPEPGLILYAASAGLAASFLCRKYKRKLT